MARPVWLRGEGRRGGDEVRLDGVGVNPKPSKALAFTLDKLGITSGHFAQKRTVGCSVETRQDTWAVARTGTAGK